MKKTLVIILLLILAYWWFKDPTISVPDSDVSFGYIVKYSGNGGRSDNLPMLVALHGNGDTAENFYNTALDQLNVPARIVLIKGPISGNAWPWTAAEFAQYGKPLSEAIESLALKYPTLGKPILLGFSGGGTMAYYQAAKHGNKYSYIFPVSGQLSKGLLGDGSYEPGAEVFAFHSTGDSIISISGGKNAVNILQENGVSVELTEFAGGHLGIFNNMKAEITQVVEQKLESLK